jgi:site-specific DNA-methyltransferase (adenine-specific)/modification methylase
MTAPVIIGNATLYHGDALELCGLLPKDAAIITDPPYGIAFSHHGQAVRGIGGGKYKTAFAGIKVIGDDRPFDPVSWLAFPVIILWGASHFASRLPDVDKWLIWDKREAESTLSFADCEIAWTNLPGQARIFRHYWNGMLKASERGEPRVHSTQKPIALMRWCIEQANIPRLIADPYMGSGTTGVAAMQAGIDFIGVEIHKPYFDIACERIDNAQRQERMFA